MFIQYRFYNKYNEFERAEQRNNIVDKNHQPICFEDISKDLTEFVEMMPLYEKDPNSFYNEGFYSYYPKSQKRKDAYNDGDPTALAHYEINVDVNEFRGLFFFLHFSLDHIFNKPPLDLFESAQRNMIISYILESGLYDGLSDFSSDKKKWSLPFYNMPLKVEIEDMMNVYFGACYERMCSKQGIWEALTQNKGLCKRVLIFNFYFLLFYFFFFFLL
jgi:hypothetical protein